MHIAIVGPIASEDVSTYLPGASGELPPGYSGAPLLSTLIAELLARGHRVSAFTTSVAMKASREEWMSAGDDKFRIYYVGQRAHAFRPTGTFVGRAADLFSVERAALEAAIRSAKPDLVHAHWAYEFGMAAIASGRPHLVSCHDSPDVVLRYLPNLYRLVRYFMGRNCLSKASAVTAVSPYLRNAVQRFCEVEVRVVQNPLPPFLINPTVQEDIFSKAKKAIRNRIAMVINGWGTRKNPEPALIAFGMLKASGHTELELNLFGVDFGPGEVAEQWCKRKGLSDNIIFHGRTPHRALIDQLRHMDFMIHPALEESCPMGIAEAMSLGLPVVGGASSGGVPWVIGNGGITVDVTSANAIADAANRLILDANCWATCAVAAAERARRTFSASTVTDLYETEYRRVLDGSSGHRSKAES